LLPIPAFDSLTSPGAITVTFGPQYPEIAPVSGWWHSADYLVPSLVIVAFHRAK